MMRVSRDVITAPAVCLRILGAEMASGVEKQVFENISRVTWVAEVIFVIDANATGNWATGLLPN